MSYKRMFQRSTKVDKLFLINGYYTKYVGYCNELDSLDQQLTVHFKTAEFYCEQSPEASAIRQQMSDIERVMKPLVDVINWLCKDTGFANPIS